MKHQIPTQLWGNAKTARQEHKVSAGKFARIQQRLADLTACDNEEAEDIVAMPKLKMQEPKMKVIKQPKPKKGMKVKSFRDINQFFNQ